MSKTLIDKAGLTFGKLKVISFASWHTYPSGKKRAKWNCHCQCGNDTVVLGSSLIPNGVTSCNICCKSGSSETTLQYLSRVYEENLSNPTDKCVEWELNKCVHNGYGRVTVDGRDINASRFIAAKQYRKDISDLSWDGCHKCGNRLCINPLHIYAGSRSENIEDQSKQGVHNSSKLSEAQVKELRTGYKQGRWKTYQSVADYYGIDVSVAYKIIKRQHYKWVE